MVERLKTVHNELQLGLEYAQEIYKRKFDRKAKPAPSFKVSDLI